METNPVDAVLLALWASKAMPYILGAAVVVLFSFFIETTRG